MLIINNFHKGQYRQSSATSLTSPDDRNIIKEGVL